ncbi:MAG: DUF1501 domain-containing protein, partial [Bryobacteraceae bacterium]
MSIEMSRRDLLCRCANGFGGLALAAIASSESLRAASGHAVNPLAVQPTHFPAKAKSVIFLYMDGGPSQVDTFDPKPLLARDHGKPLPIKAPPTQFNDNGNILGSPWKFSKHGQCGADVSELFPHVATCVDEMAIVRSMVADNSEHTAANYMLHTGFAIQGRPSMGAWLTYGIGCESDNLPAFVVLDSGLIPAGGMDNFGSGFLPAAYQGTLFRPGPHPISNVEPREAQPELQKTKLALLRKLNRGAVARLGELTELEAAISNYELAYRMQSAVPELIDLGKETQATLDLYGMNEPETAAFGRQCLMARRLVERGVRFVECLTPKLRGHDRWDQHGRLLEGHRDNARATDKPIAGLLKDLKSRGLL